MNKFKEDKKKAPKKISSFKISFKPSDQNKKVIGVGLICFGFILFLSFVSFFISFKTDFSQVEKITNDELTLLNPNYFHNWLGLVGAWLSFKFIYSWFGITAFIFPFLMVLAGLRYGFGIHFTWLKVFYTTVTFTIVWLPIFSSLIFTNLNDYLAGGYGVYANLWLRSMIGYAGVIIILAGSLISFLLINFNIDIIEKLALVKLDNFKNSATSNDKNRDTEKSSTSDKIEKEPLNTNKSTAATKPDIANVEEEIEEDEASDFEVITRKPETPKPKIEPDFEVEIEEEEEIQGMEIERVAREQVTANDIHAPENEYDPTLDLSNYKYPGIELLEEYEIQEQTISTKELEARKNLIVETLSNYKIDIDKIKATIGPTVTLFEIIPAPGIRISKIKNLEDDIALSLSALGIRIIAPIPGKGTIGIEVPNVSPEVVSMRDVISSTKFQNTEMELPIAFGRTISNEVFVTDLTKMPHLLMAGATGQGKSVGLNAIIASLLYKKHPSQVKFVMVDPKKVELSLYKHIERHFLAKLPDEEEAIITDTSKVITTLNSLCAEMDQRYDLLKEAQVRNIKEYNQKFLKRKLNPEKGHRFLPYIVLIIDELADLMMTAGKEVEQPIARLAQLARAIGIHLIVATQRPSVNIITGIIKANFPARLAFRVTSKVDSRTILDQGGADQLIGRGDMLFTTGGDLIRVQCAFVDTPEVEKICEFIGNQMGYSHAFHLPETSEDGGGGNGGEVDMNDLDALFDDAARTIVQNQQGSTSLLQRRLKLGYNRAGRLIDQLETAGIVGPHEGSKAREVLIPDEYALEQFLNSFHKK